MCIARKQGLDATNTRQKAGEEDLNYQRLRNQCQLPSADCLIEMAEVFGVSIDTLVYGETADLVSVRTLNPAQKALVAEILQVFGSNSSQKSASEQRLRLVGNLVNLLI